MKAKGMNTQEAEPVPRNLLLKQRRMDEGLSRHELAEKVNLHPSYIHHIENGTRMPPVATFHRIAKVLKISTAEFEAAGPPVHKRQRNRDRSGETSTFHGVSQVVGSNTPAADGSDLDAASAAPQAIRAAELIESAGLAPYQRAFQALVTFSSIAQQLGPDTHRQLLKVAETMVQPEQGSETPSSSSP